MSEGDKKDGGGSSPAIEEVDSAWGQEDEELDEDATTVQKIPKELVALSRRGNELEAPARRDEAPEKHEAITARPPPLAEPSMVIDAPHEDLPQAPDLSSPVDLEDDAPSDDDEEDALSEEDIDNNWGEVEEERAVAADEAAGLDAEARRAAAEARAVARKEKARQKALAAKDKRRAHVDAQRQKAKKPKRRSTPPPRDSKHPPGKDPAPRSTGRPSPMPAAAATIVPPKRDVLRMIVLVAIVVVIGALVIGLARQ